jgi:glutaredoxin
MARITFYTREDCHLCTEALTALVRVRKAQPFELEVIDLDREAPADKRSAYDWEVPVIELDGRKIMKYRLDEKRLVRLLSLAADS